VLGHLAKRNDGLILSFFFDFSDTTKQTLDSMLRSLAFQLYQGRAASAIHLDALSQAYQYGSSQPTTKALADIVSKMLEAQRKVFIVLDALDESERDDILPWIKDVKTRPELNHVQLLFTSRPYSELLRDIPHMIGERSCLYLNEQAVNSDIKSWFTAQLAQRRGFTEKPFSQNILEEIRRKIGDWAPDYILNLLGPRIDHVIEITDHIDDNLLMLEPQDYLGQTRTRRLPHIEQFLETVEPAYEEILQQCNRMNGRDVKQLLKIIVAAKRPLTVSELGVTLGFRRSAKPYRDLDPDIERKQRTFDASIITTWKPSSKHIQQPACGLFLLLSIFNVLEALKTRLGLQLSYTLRGLSKPAPTYQSRGRQNCAMQQEVLKKVASTDIFHSLINTSKAVSEYLKQGRLKDAETLQVQVLKTCKEVISEGHPKTLSSMSLLVSIYQKQGRWVDAEDLGLQVLETLTRLLGAKHLYTLSTMSNLAIACQNQGQLKNAEALCIQVLETLMGSLGADHPYTLRSMKNLALIYQNQGRFKDTKTLQMLQNRLESSSIQPRKQRGFIDPTLPSSHWSVASSRPVSIFSLSSAYRPCWRILDKAKICCKLKGLFYIIGLCESSIPPHHKRFKWTNVSVYYHFIIFYYDYKAIINNI
jgi:hypothetical protein